MSHSGGATGEGQFEEVGFEDAAIEGRRIQSSVAEGGRVDVLWVLVERYHLPPDRIKHQLVEEGVVGFDKPLNVLLRDD